MKKLAGALAVLAVLVMTACAAPTVQQRADSAAQSVSALAQKAEQGQDVSTEAQALVGALEKSTGCTVVGVNAGPISTDSATHASFVSNAQSAVTTYLEANPGFVVGQYYGTDHGAVIVLDCNSSSATPSGSA